MRKKIVQYGVIALVVIIGIIALNTQKEEKPSYQPRDYAEIIESGVLRAVTEYNAISYHVADDTLQGFDYELLHAFAADQKLKLEITPEMSFEQRLKGVTEGKFDILATGTVITTQSKDTLLFTHPLALSKQVLVQRKQEEGEPDSTYITSQLDLAHKKLHVIKGSPALLRLHNLMNEIADTIYIEEVAQYGPEQLLAMVAGKDIDYAVCDENIASQLLPRFPNLDINTAISFTQFYAWGVSKHAPVLLDSLNLWLDQFSKTKAYRQLQQKYFN